MNNRIELLKKKQVGKLRWENYKENLLAFNNPVHIELEESQVILKNLNFKKTSSEIINEAHSFIESDLLRNTYTSLDAKSNAYIFTDDFEYCGIFLVNAKKAFESALDIAKKDENHTCFILDGDNKYFFRINYYDALHNAEPNTFDIEKSYDIEEFH